MPDSDPYAVSRGGSGGREAGDAPGSGGDTRDASGSGGVWRYVPVTVPCVVALGGLFTVAGVVPRDPVERLLGGWFALAVLGAFAPLSVTGAYFPRVADHHLGGWVFGAAGELAWVGWVRYRRG